MNADGFRALRKALGLTQAEMAGQMGLSKSALAAMEGGKAAVRSIHVLAAERVAIALAASGAVGPMSVPDTVRADCARLFVRLNGTV